MSANPYEAPKANLDMAAGDAPPAQEARPIGGWLILVIIGLVVTPLRIGYMMITNHLPIFRDGVWGQLTTPGGPGYHPLWGPFIGFEILANSVTVLLSITVLVYLLRRSRKTPRLAIILYSWGVLFVVADYFVGNLIPAVASHPDPESVREVVRSVVGAGIWIPYFMVSKRVKATFLR